MRSHSIDEIREFPIRADDRNFRLGDIAEVSRGFSDPAAPKMRFMGKDGIGIAVSMRKGGDIIALGKSLEAEFQRLQKTLPVGIVLEKVSDQPAAVEHSVSEFVKVLAEAVVIVLLVSFFSLGKRPGLVVALSIPLVLAMTFAAMYYFDIGLHKISLGALILALGLLVDDAIIAVEMMAVKMEQGFDRLSAASFAYTSTAFPMLTGTLITAAGFLPIATANSSTGEYTRSIFQVVTIALLLSWIAAVVFIPYLGYRLLPDSHKAPAPNPKTVRMKQRLALLLPARMQSWFAESGNHHNDPYDSTFYRQLKQWVGWCVDHRTHGDAGDPGRVRRVGAAVPLRAAAVLPGLDPAGADGRPGAGRRRLAEGHPARGLCPGSRAGQAQGSGQLRRVRRHRFAALLPAARPETAADQLRPVRDPDQGHRIPRRQPGAG